MSVTRKGLTGAMIEALRRIQRGVSLDANPGVLLMTLEALQARGLIVYSQRVVSGRVCTDAGITSAGLKKLRDVRDVTLKSWRREFDHVPSSSVRAAVVEYMCLGACKTSREIADKIERNLHSVQSVIRELVKSGEMIRIGDRVRLALPGDP